MLAAFLRSLSVARLNVHLKERTVGVTSLVSRPKKWQDYPAFERSRLNLHTARIVNLGDMNLKRVVLIGLFVGRVDILLGVQSRRVRRLPRVARRSVFSRRRGAHAHER